jgi:predicted aldo/keto reductase-like oxidoreductase
VTSANDTSPSLSQVRLGASGLHVSRIGLGMMSYAVDRGRGWPLDAAAAGPIVRRAFELGVTFFDAAVRVTAPQVGGSAPASLLHLCPTR